MVTIMIAKAMIIVEDVEITKKEETMAGMIKA